MTNIPQEVVDRMIAVLRAGVARADEIKAASVIAPGEHETLVEARAVLALLPEPVDPDLIEARKITAAAMKAEGDFSQTNIDDTLTGAQGDDWDVLSTLQGIKRGRELASGDRS